MLKFKLGCYTLRLRKPRRVPGLRAVDEGAVPASAPATSRLFVLHVATHRWVLTDNRTPNIFFQLPRSDKNI